MPLFRENLLNKIKDTKPRDMVYPGILFFFAIIVCVLFFLATKFISKNINNALTGNNVNQQNLLNTENYTIVAKKLGITVSLTPNQTVQNKEEVATQNTEPGTELATIDKKTLTIQILNATAKKGLAGALAANLSSAGYATAAVGNEPKNYSSTIITIKESLLSLAPDLLKEVQKTYPDASTATSTDDSKFDITIIIGKK